MDFHPFFLGCRVLSWGIRRLLGMLAFLTYHLLGSPICRSARRRSRRPLGCTALSWHILRA